MTDNQIQELFDNYKPSLASDRSFMDSLQERLDAVEAVKRHCEARERRSRRAVAVAALAGFVAGAVFTFVAPALIRLLNGWLVLLPVGRISFNVDAAVWAFAACVTALISLSSYSLSFRVIDKS